jgi:hypothetical protein
VPDSTVVGGTSNHRCDDWLFLAGNEDVGVRFALSSQVVEKPWGLSLCPEELTLLLMRMQAAYTDAPRRLNEDETRKNVGGGDIGTTPGVYTFTAILITADIILGVA